MTAASAAPLADRWVAARPFVLTGAAAVVAGGLVAAGTAAVPSEHGAWVSAFLVLVAGVAQIALGGGQPYIAKGSPGRRVVAVEYVALNAGCVAVVAGTLLNTVIMVDVGGAALVVALVMFVYATRAGGLPGRVWWLAAYRALAVGVLISVPVGLVLARL